MTIKVFLYIALLLPCLAYSSIFSMFTSKLGYQEKDGKIYYVIKLGFLGDLVWNETVIDFDSFRKIDSNFAIDRQQAYYKKYAIAGSDPVTFKILKDGYTKDAKYVYFLDKKIDEADVLSFLHYKEDYWKDGKHYFINAEVIPGIDASKKYNLYKYGFYYLLQDEKAFYGYVSVADRKPKVFPICDMKSFEKIKTKSVTVWTRDSQCYYADLGKIPSLSYESIQILKWGFAKDDKQVYYENKVLEDADPKTFKILDILNTARDKKHYYVFSHKGYIQEDGSVFYPDWGKKGATIRYKKNP